MAFCNVRLLLVLIILNSQIIFFFKIASYMYRDVKFIFTILIVNEFNSGVFLAWLTQNQRQYDKKKYSLSSVSSKTQPNARKMPN